MITLLTMAIPGVAMANEPPMFTSPATAVVVENSTFVMTLSATDPDLDPVTFSISGGADDGLFQTSGTSGETLEFVGAPDHETPLDSGGVPGDNDYEVELTADDGNAGVTTQLVVVTVADANEEPTLKDAAFAVSELAAPGTKIGRVDGTDPDAGDAVVGYAIVAGDPGGALAIASNGTLTVVDIAELGAGAPFELTVRGFDGAGLSGDAKIDVSLVPNQAPVIVDAGSVQRGDEGDLITLDPVRFTDADSGDQHTAVVDWGDGIVEAVAVDAAAEQVVASHVYADQSVYTVGVTIIDSRGASAQADVTVRIRNRPPVIAARGAVAATEGGAATIPAVSFSDAGTLDAHPEAEVRWRDGTAPEAVTVLEAPFGPPGSVFGMSGFLIAPPHVYADNGSYTARLCVRDDDGARTCQGIDVEVANAPPVVTAPPAPIGVPEGSPLILGPAVIDDPGAADTHTATASWDDGTPNESAAVVHRTLTPPPHVYADSGQYDITLCAEDDDGAQGCVAVPASIANVDPAFVRLAITDTDGNPTVTFDAGDVAVFTGEFVDPGADEHVVIVEWGDGDETSRAVAPGARTFELRHTYAAAHPIGEPYVARVTIRDDDGGAAAVGGPVVVRATDVDGVGLFDPETGTWHLRGPAGAVTSFTFGATNDLPLAGDWDCDGISTPAVYRPSTRTVYLLNVNRAAPTALRYSIGQPGDIPLAGDFDADGCDTISLYRPSSATFIIHDTRGADGGTVGDPATQFVFGDPGDKPFSGDFDGDGDDEVGLHRETTGLVYFRLSLTTGNADSQFVFGDPGDRFVAGDWTGAGFDRPALFRPSNTTFFFRFTNTQGNADDQFAFGDRGFLPVSGVWDLDPPAGATGTRARRTASGPVLPGAWAAVTAGTDVRSPAGTAPT